jgi:hypothetical protein
MFLHFAEVVLRVHVQASNMTTRRLDLLIPLRRSVWQEVLTAAADVLYPQALYGCTCGCLVLYTKAGTYRDICRHYPEAEVDAVLHEGRPLPTTREPNHRAAGETRCYYLANRPTLWQRVLPREGLAFYR